MHKLAQIKFSFTFLKLLGYNAEPEKVSRNRIGNLGTMAASLLVLQPVMKGAVAEAFLNCLAATKKYQVTDLLIFLVHFSNAISLHTSKLLFNRVSI